ncbi:MAG: hypothetical protein KBB71_08870 [Lentimicrobiaceae bacterium]|nr:hypothetical protein [Lentimicrobiaceae bacterium]
MKKKMTITIVMLNGLFLKTFAGTGNASDGFEGVMVIIGFLSIIAALLYLSDYLKKNGNMLFQKTSRFVKRVLNSIKIWFEKNTSEYQRQPFYHDTKSYE